MRRTWSHPSGTPLARSCLVFETPFGPRKVAQGQRHTQAETKPTSLTFHISLLEARDLALGRGSPPVCTEAHIFLSTTTPWRQLRGKLIVSFVHSHTNATRIGWHMWEIEIQFAPGLPPGWSTCRIRLRRLPCLQPPQRRAHRRRRLLMQGSEWYVLGFRV